MARPVISHLAFIVEGQHRAVDGSVPPEGTAIQSLRRDLTERFESADARRERATVDGRLVRLVSDLDGFDVVCLVALAAVSMWVVVLNLWWSARFDLVWTGVDGEFPVDQMQYLAWVQAASHHLLVSDLFGMRASGGDFLQPMVMGSGALAAIGAAPWLAVMLWKPVAVVAVFFAYRSLCHRLLSSRAQRRTALVLGLFAALPGTPGDEWIPFLSWGYLYGLVAVAAMVAALIVYDRAPADGRLRWGAPGLGLLASWLHPWQGELLILALIGGEVWRWRAPSGVEWQQTRRQLVFTLAATAAPLVYYAWLRYSDPAWRAAETITLRHPWSLASTLWPLAPLIIGAALAFRTRPHSMLAAAVRVWPFGAMLVWLLSREDVGATPLHAWTAITFPLAILATNGVSGLSITRSGWRRWGAVGLVAVLTIPGSVQLLRAVPSYVGPATHNQNLVSTGDQRALSWLANSSQPGAVLSDYRLGDAVPGETGRRTYGGDYRWSGPRFVADERAVRLLELGRMTPAAARRFVLGTGARFVLSGCPARGRLARSLAPITRALLHFGCAAVFEIRWVRGRPAPERRSSALARADQQDGRRL